MTRRFLVLLVLAFLSVSVSYAQNSARKSEKKASIALDSTVARLGVFPKSDSKRTTVYTFKNVGNDKLVFYDGGGDCGCITVSYPDKPIKPGKKGKIIVTYNGHNISPGKFNRKIYFAVSGKPQQFILRLTGEMTKN
ncbi:MAG: DUF1573 domain-containing protein [Bacteroidales bacterium]|nr:DUF1573 domain-containing protein [Bacteroidales bacterium]